MGWSPRLLERLEELGQPHKILTHEPIRTITDAERVLKIPTQLMVKTLLCWDSRHQRLVLACIPGNSQLSWKKIAVAANTSRAAINLLPADKLVEITGDVDSNLPPFGYGPNCLIIFHKSLAHNQIYCSAGTINQTLTLEGDILIRLSGGKISDIC